MLGTALRRSAGIRGGDSVDERAQKLRAFVELDGPEPEGRPIFPFLGEILGLELPDSVDARLRAARRDPPMMSVHVRDAFNAWVKRAAQSGLVIALDDLHWADEPSVRLIDAALGAFPELPLFVVALGRPEVQRAFPRLFETRDIAELKLGRLSKRASEDLVAAVLGESATPALVAAIVARAEGNAFFLEELVRAGASGGVDNLPDTVLGVIESRLAELEPDARVVLRAASVFGEQCWKSAVESVLGSNTAIRDVPGWLRTLTQREVLVESPQSRFAGQTEYVFRHALLRDASYASFVDGDRRLAHDRAARWLDEHGEGAAIVIARHWERALNGERAVEAYTRALVQALRSNDLGAVVQVAERAEQNGAAGVALGRVRLLESEAYTWLGTPDQALHAARQALELLPERSSEFYTALAGGLEAAVLLGDADAVAGLLPKLDAALSDDSSEGREARVASLARVASALVLFGRGDEAKALLAAAERLATEPLDDPMSVGHLDHAHAATAMVARDLEGAASYFLAAGKAFERAGALRPASGAQANVAAVYLEMGAAGPALASLERAREMAERAGARYSLGLTELNRGIALTRLGRVDEAIELLEATRAELERQGDRRLAASASCARAEALIVAGRKGEAGQEAERAVATAAGLPSSRAAALAMLASVKLALGSVDAALELAERAESERGTTTMEEREALLELVFAEAELQSGRTASAQHRLARVASDLLRRAESIKTPELRRAFLEDVPEHARLLSLARQITG